MSLTGARLCEKLLKDFSKRDDMALLDDFDADAPDIVGMLKREYVVSRTNESTFQMHNRTAPENHLIGFCVETKLDPEGNLTKKAIKFKEWWEKMGGIYVIGRSEWDVYNGLGLKWT